MVYRDFTIDILISGSLLEMGPSEFSFSMHDSIYSMFPTLEFSVNDPVGLFHEFLMFLPGEEIEITYGKEDKLASNKYISNSHQTQELMTPGFLNGVMKMKGIHSFAKNQSRLSYAYDGSPSSVVEELVASEGFSELKIDSSENTHIWYRPLITQEEFIRDILLENVYSNDSNETPFFAFVDSNNVFHFESFFSLMEQSPEAELEFTAGQYGEYGANRLFSFQPFSEEYSTLREGISYSFFEQPEDSFEYEEVKRTINEIYPTDYLLSQESEVSTGYDFYKKTSDKAFESDLKGYALYLQRKSLLTNKAFISLPLNTALVSGKTIDLSVATSFSENESSISYSGKYLIEQSRHVWLGSTQNGYTELVIARKGTTLPSDYLVKERLFSQ